MKTYRFTSNINCGSCIAKVSPFLEGETRIQHWEVDTSKPDKTLTVKVEGMSEVEVVALVASAGYVAEKKKGLFNLFS